MAVAITLRSVTKSYTRGGETLRVLDELDLEMDAATFYALMGPSGSGKTTLLNLVGGLDRAAAELELVQRLNRELGKTILMVTHDPQAATFADKVIHLDKGKLGRIDDNRAPAGAAKGS